VKEGRNNTSAIGAGFFSTERAVPANSTAQFRGLVKASISRERQRRLVFSIYLPTSIRRPLPSGMAPTYRND